MSENINFFSGLLLKLGTKICQILVRADIEILTQPCRSPLERIISPWTIGWADNRGRNSDTNCLKCVGSCALINKSLYDVFLEHIKLISYVRGNIPLWLFAGGNEGHSGTARKVTLASGFMELHESGTWIVCLGGQLEKTRMEAF